MAIIDQVRSLVYGAFFGEHNPVSTPKGYAKILETLEKRAERRAQEGKVLRILDVGCGDGIYFTHEPVIRSIKANAFEIDCIDVDAGAVEICQERLRKSGLRDKVSARAVDLREVSEKYDVIIFMESYPVIPTPLMAELILHAKTLSDELLLYHNLVLQKGVVLSYVKPLIKYVSLVDFGKLTSVDEMTEECRDAWGFPTPEIDVLLSCTWGEMNPFLNVPFVRGQQIEQYLVRLAN